MDFYKFWHLFCLVILISGLYTFHIYQNENVNFKRNDVPPSLKYAVCFRIRKYLDENRSKGYVIPSNLLKNVHHDLQKVYYEKKLKFVSNLKENVTFETPAKNLNFKFKNLEKKIVKSFDEIRRNEWKNYFENVSFKELIKLEDSYFKNDLACYLVDDKLLDYLSIFNEMIYRLYVYTVEPTFHAPYLIFDHDHQGRSSLVLGKVTINMCPHKKTKLFVSLYGCLNNCLLEKGRSLFFKYTLTDDQRVYLNDTKRNFIQEKVCYHRCFNSSSNYCFIETIISMNLFYESGEFTELFDSYRNSFFVFWIQVVSIVVLFTNTSVYYLMTKSSKEPVRFLLKVLEDRKFAESILRNTKWLLFSLCCISTVAIFSFGSFSDYLASLKIPVRTHISNFSFLSENFSIIICVPVQLNLKRANQFFLQENENLFGKYSFGEIENLTNNDLEIVLKKAYLKTTRKLEINLQRSENVYFKQNHLTVLNMSLFSRCFRVKFPENELALYQDLLIPSDLILELDDICYYKNNLSLKSHGYEFTERLCQIYLLDDFQPFNSKIIRHWNDVKMNRYRNKKSRSLFQKNCTDYLELGCFDRQTCIERCINGEFLRKHGNVTIVSNTVIDKSDFNQSLIFEVYFNETSDERIVNECTKKFVLDDCFVSFFDLSLKPLNQHDSQAVEISSEFENFEDSEVESLLVTLFNDVLNIVTLFFGTNLNVLATYVASLVSRHFQISRKWIRVFVILCGTVGFLLHSYMSYESIVHAPLISSNYYVPHSFYPNLTFCFHHNLNVSKIDPNSKFTGAYLNQQTSHLTPDTLFDKIALPNKFDELINLYPHHLNVSTYFILDQKCFVLELDQIRHKPHELYFRSDAFPLKIVFNKETMKNVDYIEIESKISSIEKNFKLQISTKQSFFGEKKKKLKVRTQSFVIEQFDQFKRLAALLKGDFKLDFLRGYLDRIVEHLHSKYKVVTLNLTIEEDNFDLEIDDELFLQFFEQRKDIFNKGYSDVEERHIFDFFVQEFEVNRTNTEEADLEFDPVSIRKHTLVQNEEGVAKLFIGGYI